MNEFLRSFTQGPDGSWTCIRDCSYAFGRQRLDVGAGACFRRGELAGGIDVASLLEHGTAFA